MYITVCKLQYEVPQVFPATKAAHNNSLSKQASKPPAQVFRVQLCVKNLIHYDSLICDLLYLKVDSFGSFLCPQAFPRTVNQSNVDLSHKVGSTQKWSLRTNFRNQKWISQISFGCKKLVPSCQKWSYQDQILAA